VIREVFLDIKQAVERILSTTTLEVLVNRQREILARRILVPLDLPSSAAALLPVISE
jgi:hypothetical protein